jgi:hypothetical protein
MLDPFILPGRNKFDYTRAAQAKPNKNGEQIAPLS